MALWETEIGGGEIERRYRVRDDVAPHGGVLLSVYVAFMTEVSESDEYRQIS
jgi:hypothetical protein